ncbi:MAG TPA: uracil-DNA glycosylase [Ignavibacteria bacterium]|nr:uracil-DNA glycosylase [Ignavibacteria bacterium]
MSREKAKILEDTLNYLKFYKEYNNYIIYESDVKESASGIDFSLTEKTEYSTNESKVEISSEPAVLENISVAEIKTEKITKKIESEAKKINSGINWDNCGTLVNMSTEVSKCCLCNVLSEKRTQTVFGFGNPDAEIVVIGEAPGAEEDVQGKPFVGRAGKLLTDILKAINFDREEIYICNILKCRPPENRNPLPDEIANCEPYLYKQLELIKPKMILALGTFAAQTLLKSKEPLGKLRGKLHLYNGIKMMVTYHPAALLRNPSWKKPTWEDVQIFRKEFDLIKGLK